MNEQKLNTKLVKEVEKHPVLYNFKLPGYSRKDETDFAWSEVGKAVNMTGVISLYCIIFYINNCITF